MSKAQKIVEKLFIERLEHLDLQSTPLSSQECSEVLRIKAALDADKPLIEIISSTIFNAIHFLHHDYDIENDEQFTTILSFLEAFHDHTREDLMSKSSTYKQGMAMDVSGE